MTKAKPISAFRSIVIQVSKCPTAGSIDVTMLLLHKLILRPPAQFWCCQVLITKLSVTIYVSSLYKQTNNCFYRRHNTANVRKSQLVAQLLTENCNFGKLYVIGGCSLRSGQLFYSPYTSTCRTVTHRVH